MPFGGNGNTSGSASTVYSVSSSPLGVASTVTDEGGKSRTTVFDGMGRMEQVTENGVPNAVTTYGSDLLDNIQTVRSSASSFGCTGSGSPNRSFAYDSLSRLWWTCNPENGTIVYSYYDNSNLYQRQDAAGKVSTLYYDKLNRVTQKTYSDQTPTVSYTYAGTNQTQDFLASESAGNTTESYSNYDALGRPGAVTQTTNGKPYPFTSIQWTPQGQMASVVYPSGRTVTTGFDGAGRPNSVTGTLNGTPTYYAGTDGIAYASHGGLTKLNTADGVNRSIDYNGRLQVASVGASSNSAGNLMSLTYSYGTSPTTNNGNLSIETIVRPGLNVTQSFGYDAANRLTDAGEGPGAWSQHYVIDAMGNRAVSASAYIPSQNFTPQTSDSTVPYDQHNHWLGATYDSSGNGNMTGLVSQSLAYDAENRLISLNDSGAVTSFTYDEDGRRVTKTSGGVTTNYVYGPDGQLAVEDGGSAPVVSGTVYVTTDRMGSTRLVTNGSGFVGCQDYLPFGEAIPATVGGWGRDGVPCYAAASGTNVGYVGQLFDSETGLSYFNARYLRASMGSFTSADEPMNDQWGDDPQSWKLDSYARNNPLRFGDPSGLDCIDLSNFSSTGDWTVLSGDCSNTGLQTEVPGYVTSGTYDQSSNTISYNYTGYDGAIGSGVIQDVPEICDFRGLCGAANQAGAAQIVNDAGPPVEGLGQALVGFILTMLGREPELPESIGGKEWEPPTQTRTKWRFGSNKSNQKWLNQLRQRGWTPQQVDEAVERGQRFPAPNNVNPANGATRYVHPITGRSVVIDNVTGELLHVGGDGFRY